jgi:tetratricopeptide (TPR) repeat protein
MILKHLTLLTMIMLISACNMQNAKPESQSNLEDLIELRNQADAAYETGNWNQAIEHYETLSQTITNDVDLWFRLGNAHARLKHPGIALQAYQKALSLDSNNGKIWHNMGIVQLKLATNTFIEMQKHTTADDPLNHRALQVVNAISKLLQQDFGVEATK